MTSLVLNTPLRFSRRVDRYEALDQPKSIEVSKGDDEDRSHGGRSIIMKLRRSGKQRSASSPIMLSSISYRRKRNIFLHSYKLKTNSEKLRNRRKLKKIVVKVKSAMVSVLSFMRAHTMKSCTNSNSGIGAASPVRVIRCC
ncbi:hypothetical protein HAX54_048013 [Datura stramonium]|uniref:Uncharacterized protein n=1 Tax=Datura stramonium TaxID=4076 RepID=A0ABS8STB1_DATST|nr:hypothetical protein [Datura stramonium]